jgi:subtilisin family serine protease
MRQYPTAFLAAVLLGWMALPLSAGQDAFAEGEALVVFKPGVDRAAAGRVLGRHALKLDRHFARISKNRQRVTGFVKGKGHTTTALLKMLQADANIDVAEPNYLRRIRSTIPNDPEFSKLWGLKNSGQTVNGIVGTSGTDTNFLPAWKLARASSADIVIGVVDTGVDITHPDLAANIWTNPGEIPANGIDDDGNGYVDDVNGYNFTGGNADANDIDSHGTHIAGTIAATGKNGVGVIGLQYRAKILPMRVSADGLTISTAAAIEAYEYAIHFKQNGVNIAALNASYGGPSFSSAENSAIAALRDNGIILCAAAGNEAVNNDVTPSYPANYNLSNIISIASINQSNGLSSFSNFGASTVDIAAPGSNIYSTLPQHLATTQSSVTAGVAGYASRQIVYCGTTSLSGISGSIHACGLGYPGDFPPAVSGNIALIQRGTITFATKIANAKNAGAVAAIVYDNITDPITTGSWTLNSVGAWIPAVRVTKASGEAILAGMPSSGTVVNYRDPAFIYQFLSGTSMATPHVAGAVAFAAWNFPAETMAQRITRITANVTPVAALAGKMTTGGRLDLLKMIDTDLDGLPDWWEGDQFGNLAEVSSGDEDADGFSNLDEFRAGTDPRNASSHLSFSSFATIESGAQTHFVLSFPSVEERGYRIEWSGSLEGGSWQPLGPPLTGTGGMLQVQDTNAIHVAGRRFYRMSLLPD